MRHSFIRIFRRPYALNTSVYQRLGHCLFFGLFIFVFLWIFQPFGLNTLPHGILKISAVYGGCTFIAMFVLNILMFPLLPAFFDEEKWNLGRELGWSLVNFLMIGLINALVSPGMGLGTYSFRQILWFEFFTLTVGMIPWSFIIVRKESLMSRKFHQSAEQINARINSNSRNLKKLKENTGNKNNIVLNSSNRKDSLVLQKDELLYIASSDNYVEVVYLRDFQEIKTLLRNTLKSIAGELSEHKDLLRCHKGFLVNLNKVIHVSGNAQGYKLHLRDSRTLIPVSRKSNSWVKKSLMSVP